MLDFKKQYKKLNKNQKEAVDTIEGPVMVIAGPGTGKTTILTLRIANILKRTDTPANGILALTFTESGVRAIKKKLQEIIGEKAREIRVHTFHSFASSIIREFDDHFPELYKSSQITEIEAEDFVRKIIQNSKYKILRPLGEPDFYIRKIIEAISFAKQEAWTPEMLKSFAGTEIENIKKDESFISSRGESKGKLKAEALKRIEKLEKTIIFSQIYKEYEHKKKNEYKIDFDDLIFSLLLKLREDELLLKLLQENFLYILVDEHQDTNDSQNLVVKYIIDFFDTPNIFIVGDEKQAIFRFQGASIANFLEFQNRFKEIKTIFLEKNYRSTQHILDASFHMIEQNYKDNDYGKLNQKLISISPKNEKIEIAIAGDAETEEMFLVNKIKEVLKEGYDKDVAVIVRNNKEIGRLISLFKNNDLEASAERGVDIFNHPFGSLFFSLVSFFGDQSQTEEFAKTVASGLWNLKFGEQIDLLKYIRRGETTEIIKKIPEIEKIIKDMVQMGALEAICHIAQVSGLVDIAKENTELMEIWRGIYELSRQITYSKNILSPKILIENLLLYKKTAEKRSIKIKQSSFKSKITIITAHSSKGLEYDFVFMPFCTDSNWFKKHHNSYFVFPKEKEIIDNTKDERRLFFVSLTRAKEKVFVSFAETNDEGEAEEIVRFANELNPNSVEIKKINKITKEDYKEIKTKETNKEKYNYIKMSILENGLSITAINHFLECPMKFYYKSILKVPEAPNVNSEKGNAMHEALSNVWKQKHKNNKNIEKIIKKSITDYFKKSFLAKKEKEIIIQELLGNAPVVAKELENHFENIAKTEFWVEKPFRYQFDKEKIEINLHGRLDAIIEDNNEINVFDYKTKKSMSINAIMGETKNENGDYFRQLIFYKILLENKNKKINPYLVFVVPDIKNKCPIIYLETTKEDENKLIQNIESLLKSVWSEKLLDRKCNSKNCQFCNIN